MVGRDSHLDTETRIMKTDLQVIDIVFDTVTEGFGRPNPYEVYTRVHASRLFGSIQM